MRIVLATLDKRMTLSLCAQLLLILSRHLLDSRQLLGQKHPAGLVKLAVQNWRLKGRLLMGGKVRR